MITAREPGGRRMSQEKLLNLTRIQQYLDSFAKDRDWEQFHTPKNLVLALTGEVGELAEIFQWLTVEEARQVMSDPRRAARTREELADILQYVIRLASVLEIDLNESLWAKLKLNESKYPIDLARGNAKKYTELASE
jgi:NTP pyrophosphatase (non-canonical NTP hydrolase)